tara:strand:- start:1124 stop:1381 length:258 start_codon:yes stop_codon:yes gene_type:complete
LAEEILLVFDVETLEAVFVVATFLELVVLPTLLAVAFFTVATFFTILAGEGFAVADLVFVADLAGATLRLEALVWLFLVLDVGIL